MTFPKDALPPVDRDKGGFWSLTMYDQDYYMLPTRPNGRHNIGTVNLDADELEFAADGSLTLHLSHRAARRQGRAGQLAASAEGQFALIVAPTCRHSRCSTAATSCQTCSGSEPAAGLPFR